MDGDRSFNVSIVSDSENKSPISQPPKDISIFAKSQNELPSFSVSTTTTQECGCGQFKPTWLQYFHNAKCFLVCLCLCSITQGMVVNGLIPVSITTLEKRFHLTSTQSGFLASFYDVAVILALAPITHFGGHGHKPRWMGYGVILMGVGSLLFALPQFLVGHYSQKAVRETCSFNYTGGLECAADSTKENDKDSNTHLFFYVLLLGQLLHGLGASPLYTLGVTFLDESVAQLSSPVYLGLFYGFSIFGPVFGFVLGGAFLSIYGDIDKKIDVKKVVTTPDDPLWYGAWWLGFIVAGILAITFGVPLLTFAPRLPEAEENRANDVNQAQNVKNAEVGKKLKDFPKAVLNLVKNLPFIFIIAMKCAEAFLMNGFVTFVPKMLENFFSLSARTSSMLAGAVLIPGGLFGTVLGGYIVRQFKMKCKAMIVMAFVSEFISMFFVLGLLIYCSESRFIGVNEGVNKSTSFVEGSVINECNENCACSSYYNPVCHRNSSLVYFSPCHAGCTGNATKDDHSGVKQWSNCTCTSIVAEHGEQDVVQGYCPLSCNWTAIFLVICGVQIFLTFVASMPVQQVELRCVSFEQRTLAVSFSWVFARLLGTIPGAILIGYAIDNSCSLWKKDCDGKKASCLRYNNMKFSYSVVAIGMGLKLVICMFLVMAWWVYRPIQSADTRETSETNDSIIYSSEGSKKYGDISISTSLLSSEGSKKSVYKM